MTQESCATFENTQNFYQAALFEGADLYIPSKVTPEDWYAQLDTFTQYCLEPDTTQITLSDHLGISREAVRQRIEGALTRLRVNCSENTQALFPLDTLRLRKPLPQTNRNARSEKTMTVSAEIRKLIVAGESYEELLKAGYSTDQICNARNRLRNKGTSVPYLRQGHELRDDRDFLSRLQTSEDFNELQDLVDRIKNRAFYQAHTGKEDPLFVSLRTVLAEAEFHYCLGKGEIENFIASLKHSEIAVAKVEETMHKDSTTQRYLFILAKHREKAIEALMEDPTLDRFVQNPVEKILGRDTDTIPTTTHFSSSEGSYASLRNLFVKLGLSHLGKCGYNMEAILKNCGVPIFRYRHRDCYFAYRYPINDQKELKDYIKNFIERQMTITHIPKSPQVLAGVA